MKLAYSTLACPGWTVEEAADAVDRYGFDGIEWRLADHEPITRQTPEPTIQRVVAATRSRGLRVAAVDSSCCLAQPDAQGRAEAVREGAFIVDLAATLGAPLVRVFGGPLPPGVSVDEALAPAAEVLNSLAQYAGEHLRVLLETHDPAWSRSANALALLEAAGQPPAGLLYDVLHPCRMGESVEQTIATLGRHVALVHLKDGRQPPDGSAEWPLCALGAGDVPLGTVLAALSASGYEGWYTFEWEKRWHPELAEPEAALPAGLGFLRALAESTEASSQLPDKPRE
jgi:sugar phosphate isomerase/epimerase